VDPVPDPLLPRKCGSAGNGTRTPGSVAIVHFEINRLYGKKLTEVNISLVRQSVMLPLCIRTTPPYWLKTRLLPVRALKSPRRKHVTGSTCLSGLLSIAIISVLTGEQAVLIVLGFSEGSKHFVAARLIRILSYMIGVSWHCVLSRFSSFSCSKEIPC
jgi:hypothetical protein